MSEQSEPADAPRQRGPGYPAIDLETAIERTRQLAKVSDKHPVPIVDAAIEWGFSPRSSNTLKAAAALKRFGLIDDVGDGKARKLRVTADGRELLFYAEDRGNPKWSELLQAAALRPKIHREVFDHYDGTLPDDRVVLAHLQFDKGMHSESARDFLRRLRKTAEFAALNQPRSSGRDPEIIPAIETTDARVGGATARASGGGTVDVVRPYGGPVMHDLTTGEVRLTSVNIPYSPGKWASLNADFPLSESDWEAMLAMLAAMKPGLVAERWPPEAADH